MSVSIGLTGATGHMANTVLDIAPHRDVRIAFAVSESDPGGEVGGIPVEPAAELPALLESHTPDALVDFTVPESSIRYVRAAAQAGVAVVVGTTGFSEDEQATLRDASEEVAVLHAANFARGIQALVEAVRQAVSALPGYDIELTETHHNRKRDAPSGTAKTVLAAIQDTREGRDGEPVYGREGSQPREPTEIGVHVRRAGDIRGEHEVLLAENDEVVTVTHRAESRAVFAAGALDAAEWIASREPGWYEFGEVVDA